MEEDGEKATSNESNPPANSDPSSNPSSSVPPTNTPSEETPTNPTPSEPINNPDESRAASPVHSPTEIQTPPAYTPQRRRSSLIPPDMPPETELISMSKRRSGSRSPRRGSQAFLIGEDTIIMQLDSGKRRLSSFCTTSSNDETIITVEDTLTDEEILETLRAHKQIVANIKTQNWPMHKKLKILRRAKLYIKKHEGDLKQSKQAKDIVATYRAYIEKTINRLKREIDNLIVILTPWELRIKKIESQFGSVVASYFIFLRWVFWINTLISIFICCFIMVPEVLIQPVDKTGMRKEIEDSEHALDLKTIWEFGGYLKYSPIFYGYYSNVEEMKGYRLPLAYFLTLLVLYMFSFFCILRQMAKNARTSRVSTKEDEYVFTWKLYTGWDYMIGNSETAHNKMASTALGFKEVILEEKEKSKVENDWKLILRRIIANILVLILLISSAYAVYLVVERSQNMPPNSGWIRENEVTLVVAGISNVFPNLFNIIALLEDHHPRIQLRWQLARILVLNMLNLYTLMFSLFGKVDETTKDLNKVKKNMTIEKAERLGLQIDAEVSFTGVSARVKRHDGRYKIPSCDSCDLSTQSSPIAVEYEFEEGYEGRFSHRQRSKTTAKSTVIDPGGGPATDTIVSTPITISLALSTTRKSISNPFRNKTLPTTKTNEKPTTTGTTYTFRSTTKPKSTVTSTTATASSTISTILQTTSTKKSTNPSKTSSNPRPLTTSTTKKEPVEISSVSTTITIDVKTTKPTAVPRDCPGANNFTNIKIVPEDLENITAELRKNLSDLCWETSFGQELTKLTVMDLGVLALTNVLIGDFLRALIVRSATNRINLQSNRYCNHRACFFWDLEQKFPGYSDFQIAENIVHLANNQGMVWLGMFFSPGLPAINTIKLCVLMYLRSWAVLSCNIPHETVFKASGSNNFYCALLLLMLFICTLPVGYAIVWLEPSWHCGPFSDYDRMYHVFTRYLESKLPNTVNRVIEYLTSPGAVIPLILLLVLIIYYLVATLGSLRESNNDLKNQLRREKDVPEITNKPEAGSEQPVVNGIEKKHVRISEEVSTSDKAKLLQNISSVSD
ncbi:transmembrane channel-like protein 3 [Dinothrombium tinctorium]|uniref:Transmembrane channel-like protein 3 n=1 Tax=Dinothrombium tinctorium TaxID=1965070 RepID=A0A3S4QW62_9ACAR|nr:transmembrane channel-like protein 3 [Dinothrombium tinctorium]